MKVAVVGCGNVGHNTMKALAVHGHEVVGFDIDPVVRGRIQHEMGLNAVTDSLRQIVNSNVCYICVPTEPSPTSPHADLSIVNDVVTQIAEFESSVPEYSLQVVVQRSTCPPGTAEDLRKRFCSTDYCVSPSFMSKETAWEDSVNPPRIVYSGNAKVQRVMEQLHSEFGGDIPRFTPSEHISAELLKYVENTIDTVLISLWNEYLAYADHLGMDREAFIEVMCGLSQRARFGSVARVPGHAFGRGCFPKDLAALHSELHDAGLPNGVLQGAIATNEEIRRRSGVNPAATADLLAIDNNRVLPTGFALSQLTGKVKRTSSGADSLLGCP